MCIFIWDCCSTPLSSYSSSFRSLCRLDSRHRAPQYKCALTVLFTTSYRVFRATLTGTQWSDKSCLMASWPDTSVSFLRTGVVYLVWEWSCTGRVVRQNTQPTFRIWKCSASSLETQLRSIWNIVYKSYKTWKRGFLGLGSYFHIQIS